MPIIRAAQRQIETLEAANREEWISEPGGLTQFGAFVHVLMPGTRSSIKHWHEKEDEFVYVLEGELTVVEGEAEHVLGPGDAATFPAANPIGHYPWNRGATAARCLVIGTRAQEDRIFYPDHDRILHRDRSQ
jgi:uncharacterized cupin superfamily protein